MRVEREFSPTLGDYRPPGRTRTRVDESSSRDKTNERKLSATLNKNLSRFKFNESGRESPRAHESLRPNEIESLNSLQLSASLALVWPRLNYAITSIELENCFFCVFSL